jgi:transposase-like protein
MKLIDVTKQFNTESKCLDYIVAARWPNGVCCVHCGVQNVSTINRKKAGDNKRARIYQCLEKECGKQFSATSGTIFNDTHLGLEKWFMAIAMICEAKKGMSAKQLERHLGVNYRTAWHMAHRIREAMQDGGDLLTGVVETDATWMTPRKPRKGRPQPKNPNRSAVLGIDRTGRQVAPDSSSGRKVCDTRARYAQQHPTKRHCCKLTRPSSLRRSATIWTFAAIA